MNIEVLIITDGARCAIRLWECVIRDTLGNDIRYIGTLNCVKSDKFIFFLVIMVY